MALTNGPNLGVLVDGGIGEVHYDALMKQWRAMDALTQANIISASISTPPSTPADGDLYIVPTGSTGVWSSNTNKLARYSSKTFSWEYYTPKNGWLVYNKASGTLTRFNGTSWEEFSSEWSASTVSQAEAEAGTATTRRAWTAQRVKQAISAWWAANKGTLVGPVALTSGGFSIARTAVTAPSASDGNVYSGTYVPTLTNVTNLDSSTAASCQYLRVGNTVTVSGAVALDPAATGNTVLRMSLPIASAMTLGTHLGGTFAAAGTTSTQSGSISADTTTDEATFQLFSGVTSNLTYYFTFTYRVL